MGATLIKSASIARLRSSSGSALEADHSLEGAAALAAAIAAKLTETTGKEARSASAHDWYMATALALRDKVASKWIETRRESRQGDHKRVHYLSLEFLIGRQLFDVLGNLGLIDTARQALHMLGADLDVLRQAEPDAALGNGGLGRLAACFMESMASVEMSAKGYGIRYDFGLFRQTIKNGWQEERPEDWLARGNPWEFERPSIRHAIGFGGTSEATTKEENGSYLWQPAEIVTAVAFDTPIVGWRGRHINTLRLWQARALEPVDLEAFNRGDHVGAMAKRNRAEAISRLLYPSDASPAGQELRLRQEYFFTAASLQDLVRRHLEQHGNLRNLAAHEAIQLNDTHPAIAVAELMRLLVDVHFLGWEEAWNITRATLSYTNHTLLPEALETWPVPLMQHVLPRHLQIIFVINKLHLDSLRAAGKADDALIASVSLIDEHGERRVRMGPLAFLGSHKVNGVSALHTGLMRQTVFRDMNALYPDRIVNKTNGITFRRWLYQANPGLTGLIVDALGEKVLDKAELLEGLAAFAPQAAFQERFAATRAANKAALAALVQERIGIKLDTSALFDVQIKRIHEYKRQLLNILETVALYLAIGDEPDKDWAPRVKIMAGKAAPSYTMAKLIIKLANDVAAKIKSDPRMQGRLQAVFLPNYNVSLAEAIIPAADLSEQISTAGMEASGTGNMKLALNGALTIGTLDGANVEIRDRVGAENIFIFGLTSDQVDARRVKGIDAQWSINASPRLARAIEAIASGLFSPDDTTRYREIVTVLKLYDHFMVCADFDSYWKAQRSVDTLWRDQAQWRQKSILNTARTGWFSSDRTIREYAGEIWDVPLMEG